MNYRLITLLLLSVLIYFANLGGSSIYILDEAKNAGCAMEMSQRRDLIVPTFNGELRTDKPPLHYFFMMAAYPVLGFTPFAARLFSALSGVALILFLYGRVKKIIDEPTAFYSCLILLSSIQVAVQFHLAVPDPYLILFLTICLFSFYTGFHDSSKDIYWMYFAAGLAFMTKGLIAVVFPALIITFYLVLTKQIKWTSIIRLRIVKGFILFCLIALPWYAAVGYATDGEWLRGFFIEHNLDRYTNTMEGHRGFPLAPFVIVIAALLPFSVFVIHAVALSLKRKNENPFLLYCLLIVVVISGFFSFSKTILPSYPAPAFPFFAILLGYFIHQLTNGTAKFKRIHVSFAINFVLCLAVPVAIYFALQQENQLKDLSSLAWLFIVLPLGSLLGWYFYVTKKKTIFVYVWSGSWVIATLLFFYVAYPQVDHKNPVTESIPIIKAYYSDYELIAYKQFNPAYVFKLSHPLRVIDSQEQLMKVLSGNKKIIIITRTKYQQEISIYPSLKTIYQGRDLFEGSESLLLAN